MLPGPPSAPPPSSSVCRFVRWGFCRRRSLVLSVSAASAFSSGARLGTGFTSCWAGRTIGSCAYLPPFETFARGRRLWLSDSSSATSIRMAPSPSAKRRSSPRRSAATRNAGEEESSPAATASNGELEQKALPESANASASPADTTVTPRKKKAKAPPHQVLTDRDPIPKLWTDEHAAARGSYTFRIASWNVCGLRAVLKKDPECLRRLASEHSLDLVCLQETKIQPSHADDLRDALPGYDAYFSCCTTDRKGYAGTAAFVRRRPGTSPPAVDPEPGARPANEEDQEAPRPAKKRSKKQATLDGFVVNAGLKAPEESLQSELPSPGDSLLSVDQRQLLVPQRVSFSMGVTDKHDAEGRLVVLDYPLFTLINVYVPNSGQELARLSYRTDEWDPDLLSMAQSKLVERQCPVMWLGDLNVAHTHLEVWNDGARHLATQAGVTPQERASFQRQLDAGFVDAFRYFHPTARGHYSYWSQRAGNRPPNKGLRLDYFVCDQSFLNVESGGQKQPDDGGTQPKPAPRAVVRDSYVLHEQLGSDHCPVVAELEIQW